MEEKVEAIEKPVGGLVDLKRSSGPDSLLLFSVPWHMGQGAPDFSNSQNALSEVYASWVKSMIPKAAIKAVWDLAAQVFGDPEIAKDWLSQPNLYLNRIEHGVLA